MAKRKGLELLYNLLLKDAAKESGKRSGIAQIGNVTRDIAEKKFQALVLAARKQGVDLDNYTEQELKYILQLNRPQKPKVISADSPEGKLFTQGMMDMLDKASGKNIIKANFGKPFAEEMVTTERVITDIKQMKPMDSMLEANKVLKGEGRYKNLSQADREKIVNDESVTDHIFERDVPIDPEDMATGGRAGFKMGRRAFLKAAAGIGAGIGALKAGALKMFGKEGAKNLPPIKTPVTKLTNSTTQMPDWFPSFINKFRDEGKATNVFKKEKVKVSKAEYDKAIAEGKSENYYRDDARTPEYKANNPDHMDYFKLEETDERIFTTYTNDKVPGVRVDDMDGNVDVMFQNDYSQPVSMNYTAPGKKGPETGRADLFVQGESKIETKPKGEFVANDVEVYATDPDGGFDTEDVIANTVDDMLEGKTRQMEEYATGKKTKMSSGEFRVGRAEARAEQAAEEAAEAADDFASGGLAGMLGE